MFKTHLLYEAEQVGEEGIWRGEERQADRQQLPAGGDASDDGDAGDDDGDDGDDDGDDSGDASDDDGDAHDDDGDASDDDGDAHDDGDDRWQWQWWCNEFDKY